MLPVTSWSDEQFRLKLHTIIAKARAAAEKDRAASRRENLDLEPTTRTALKSSI